MLTPTVTALKSHRDLARFYETHLPAIQANTQTSARFPCSDAYQRRSRDTCTPPATRPQTIAAKRRRETLRSSHPGLIFEIRNSRLDNLLRISIFGFRILICHASSNLFCSSGIIQARWRLFPFYCGNQRRLCPLRLRFVYREVIQSHSLLTAFIRRKAEVTCA
jgi:hypothetical protein